MFKRDNTLLEQTPSTSLNQNSVQKGENDLGVFSSATINMDIGEVNRNSNSVKNDCEIEKDVAYVKDQNQNEKNEN